jgi:ribose-phosphate pyrophosphokinase
MEVPMSVALSPEQIDSIYLASGFAHPALAEDIASEMGVPLGPLDQKLHPNGEIYVRYDESVRGKHVFIVQPHVGTERTNVNDSIMQQCLLADAARSSSAAEITAVSPYLAYMRQDRKSRGREPIGTRVLIDQLAAAGVTRIVTVDMHAPQAQGIFRGPFDHLTAQPELGTALYQEVAHFPLDECIVVAPDAGAAKLADRHRRNLGMGMLHLAKQRDPHDNQKIRRDEKVPEADGRVCLVFDDMIDTAGTLVSAAEALKNSGAKAIYVAASHGILSGPAIERLRDAPIDKILITDTFPHTDARSELGRKLRIVRVAPMISRALIEIITNGSVSELFQDQNHM